MAKKKTKSKAKKKTARDPEQARRVLLGTAMTVASLAVLGAGAMGLTAVDRVGERSLSEGEPLVAIAWPEMPAEEPGGPGGTWMPESEKARLIRIALDAAEGGSPLSPEPLAEVSRALREQGWFDGPPRVERLGDGSLSVSGEWRIPAAVVRDANSRERMVSWDGVPLPLEYPIGASRVRYLAEPSIDLLPETYPAGEPWPGDDVADGLALLDALDRDKDMIAQVHGIDLNAGGALEIITDRGTRIRWGAGPLRFQPGERSTGEKLSRLSHLLERTGRIDGGARVIEIDGPQILIVSD
ncbi:MAG: hypothetical protein ACF8Q5_04005 [Phycisphaerales bacterium JB040]